MKVAIIGAGSWGTALAIKSSLAGNATYIYHRDSKQAAIMAKIHKNPEYLTAISLPEDIVISNDIVDVMAEANVVLIVTPSQYVRSTMKEIKPYITSEMRFVCCSKGLERETGKRMSQVMKEELDGINSHIAILSGPNHAEEVALNLPAMTVIASENIDDATIVQQCLNSTMFRVYTNPDMVGVEIGGTMKNIIALGAGIAHGMKLGDNLISALMARGLHEMTKFALHYGAKRETFSGLAGIGDLIATCMSNNSRNRRAGMELAKGLTMQEILDQSNMVVEGFFAVMAVYDEAKREGLDLPMTSTLHSILIGEMSADDALVLLMSRELKDETVLTSL